MLKGGREGVQTCEGEGRSKRESSVVREGRKGDERLGREAQVGEAVV